MLFPTLFLELPSKDFLVGFGNLERHQDPPESFPRIFCSDYLNQEPYPWITAQEIQIIPGKDLKQLFHENSKNSEDIEWPQITKESSAEKFKAVMNQIQIGSLQKCVISECEYGSIPSSWANNTFSILAYRLLSSESEGQHRYGISIEDYSIVGATPELLFNRNGKNLTSIALAGTSSSIAEVTNSKNEIEHHLVVEDICRQLTSVGDTHISVGEPVSFGRISHLKTVISCDIFCDASFADIVSILHPTAAIGVYPRSKSSTEFLRSICHHNSLFAAPIGVQLADEESFCVVMIRGVEFSQKNAWIRSGCGIVLESVWEQEREELRLKRETVKARFRQRS